MSKIKIIKPVGDLPLFTLVKCFGIRSLITGRVGNLCELTCKDGTLNVTCTQNVEVLELSKLL